MGKGEKMVGKEDVVEYEREKVRERQWESRKKKSKGEDYGD